jgi:transcriptional regulator with XRE-family HTH domain
MQESDSLKTKVSLLNRYVQSLCGLYSRIARQLNVDRSYVSRVARGERHSEEVERALSIEFTRITEEQAPQSKGNPSGNLSSPH